MAYLLLCAHLASGALLTNVRFQIAYGVLAGSDLDKDLPQWSDHPVTHKDGVGYVALPDSPRPLAFTVRVLPGPEDGQFNLWNVAKRWQLLADGTFVDDPRSDDPELDDYVSMAEARYEFHPVLAFLSGAAQPNSVSCLDVTVSSLRNVVDRVKQRLSQVPPTRRQGRYPVRGQPNWAFPPKTITLAGFPMRTEVTSSSPSSKPAAGSFRMTPFEQKEVAPEVQAPVLQLRMDKAPQTAAKKPGAKSSPPFPELFAVVCPINLLEDYISETSSQPSEDGFPFLVHLHPPPWMAKYEDAFSNGFYPYTDSDRIHSPPVGKYPDGHYPFAFDFVHFILFSVTNAIQEPLIPENAAMAYQIAASGKDVALVVPIYERKTRRSYGSFMAGAKMREILLEIQAYLLRRRGLYVSPKKLPRVAVSAFSDGNGQLAALLEDINTKGGLDELKEIYLFDPPDGDGSSRLATRVATSAATWARNSSARFAKAYTRSGDPHPSSGDPHSPVDAYKKQGFVDGFKETKDQLVFFELPSAWWVQAAAEKGQTWFPDKHVHGRFSGFCLTDALRRSGFESYVGPRPLLPDDPSTLRPSAMAPGEPLRSGPPAGSERTTSFPSSCRTGGLLASTRPLGPRPPGAFGRPLVFVLRGRSFGFPHPFSSRLSPRDGLL